MAHLSLSFLGTFQVVLDDVVISRFRSNKVQGMLAYLALQPQLAVPRETLAALFWPDTTDAAAKKNLRQTIYQLRQLLKDTDSTLPFLLVTRQTVQFNPDSDYHLDVLHFGQALTAGVLETAVSLYQGELLAGFTCDSLEFESWLRQEREHLHRLALSAMSDLTERQLANGKFSEARQSARRQLVFEPWRESAHQQLMLALALDGDPTAALSQYQICAELLDEELGVPPSPETEALRVRIEGGQLSANDSNLIAGRYQLGDQIGQGAMGIVYRGLDAETGRIVAIKLLDPSRVADKPELIARFLREGEILRQLNHPNIVELLATEEKDGRYYLIMAYCAGGDLQQRLLAQPVLPLDEALAIGLDMADALTRAHRLHILHRDVKPANVLLSEDGTPQLSDFGIARLGEESDMTQTGTVIGTTAYMSPEACRGEPVDERTDIWALGAVLYEMLAGERPFTRPTVAATLMAILQAPLPNIATIRPDLPKPLCDLVSHMLTKDKAARLPSMRQAAAVLDALLHDKEMPTFPQPAQQTQPVDDTGIATKPEPFPPFDSAFIGRIAEISTIIQTLNKPTCRLLTLTGPGGVGKTSLAIQVAHTLMAQTDLPATFMPLVDMHQTDDAVNLVGQKLGLSQPITASDLISEMAAQHGLLILDSVDALLVADGDAFTGWLRDLMQQTAHLQVILTARQPLNIQQEWLLPVGGLTMPASAKQLRPDQWEQYDAIALFRQRAQQTAVTTFTLTTQNIEQVVRLCQLLDGQPLGIGLTASLTRQHSIADVLQMVQQEPASIHTTLRDLPPRHRSLFAVYDQSWSLLNQAEQGALAQTAVFKNGFSRAAARAVLADDATRLPVLVEKSLLTQRDTPRGLTRYRYYLPPLLQAFLLEKDKVEEKTVDAHAEYYLAWAVDHRDQMADELENVAAAWEWAQSQGNVTVPRRFRSIWLDEIQPANPQLLPEERVKTAVLIGRDTEIARLRASLSPVLHEHKNGGLLTIRGGAGIGKTHLVAQLRAEENRLVWFDCPCDETSTASYRPFRVWLRHYFRQHASQTAAANTTAFNTRFDDLVQAIPEADLAAELTRLRSLLAALVDIILPDSLYTRLRPEQRSENFQQAIKALLKAESLLQPLVLYIEDAHWIDADSRALLENLLLHVADYPFAILITARPDGFEPLILLDAPQTAVRLEPLDAVAIHHLVAHYLDCQPSEALENLLLDRGQGNPFYTVQLLHYLRENGLVANGDVVRAGGQASLDALLPVDIHNLLAARLGKLDTDLRDVAAQAAVLGHEFSLPVLQKMSNDGKLEQALAEGTRVGIWQPLSTGRYLFNHALLREAAYDSQFARHKQELHKQAAKAITAVATPEQPHFATLAHHYDEAGQSQKAVNNYLKAGDEARNNYFIREAHSHYSRGLDLVQKDKQRLPLLLGREAVNHWLGNREEQRADLNQLETLATSSGNQTFIADVVLRQAIYALAIRDYVRAIQHAQRATSLAVSLNDRQLEAQAMHRWGRALWQQGKPKAAFPILRRALKLAQMTEEIVEQALTMYDLSALAYYSDDFSQAREWVEQALPLFKQMDSKADIARCDTMLGLIEYAKGRYEKALRYYLRAVEMSRTINWVYGEAKSLVDLGNVYFQLGDFASSRDAYLKSLSLSSVLGDLQTEIMCTDALGLILQFEGKLAAAQEKFERALTLTRSIGNGEFEAYVLTHLGTVLTNQEALEQAGIYLYEAMTLRTETQGMGISVDTEAALAWLDMARGDPEFAVERVQEILQWLNDNGPTGVELPLFVYWQCFTILKMAGKTAVAKSTLQAAYELLTSRAEQVQNELWREQFLRAIPHHHHIIEAWNTQPI